MEGGRAASGQENRAGQFERDGYVLLARLMPESLRSFLYEYTLKAATEGKFKPGDSGVPGTPCIGGDPFMETLLEMMQPRIEAESGRRLFPTYSYLRVYKKGDVLHRHQDRPSCEISVTLNLGYEAPGPWPIWVASNGAERSCRLEPGDGLLYKGIEVPHWRDAFAGEHCAQVFLHYVDQNGRYAEWKYEKKAALGASPEIRKILELFGGIPASAASPSGG